MIFQVPGVSFGSQQWVQNGVRIASSTRKPSEGLLEASWSALGTFRSRKKSNTEALLPGPRRISRPISGPKREGGGNSTLPGPVITGVPSSFSGRKNQDGKPGSFQEKQNQTFPNIAHARLTRPRARWRIRTTNTNLQHLQHLQHINMKNVIHITMYIAYYDKIIKI